MRAILFLLVSCLGGCAAAGPGGGAAPPVAPPATPPAEWDPDRLEPAAIRLEMGRKYEYEVRCWQQDLKDDGNFEKCFDIRGLLTVEPKQQNNNGSREIEMTFRLTEVYLAALPGFADDAVVKLRANLWPNGKFEYSVPDEKKAFAAAKQPGVHGCVFRGLYVIFPVLPPEWQGRPACPDDKGEEYAYSLAGPVVLYGKKFFDEENGKRYYWESFSNLVDGVVTDGMLALRAKTKDKFIVREELTVKLRPGGG